MDVILSNFVMGGLAAQGACVLTNPVDVVKTRLQLQGELAKQGTYVKPYKNMFHAMVQIARNDGILALEKGLVPALYFQFFLNATKLSIYSNALDYGLLHDDKGNVSLYRGMFFGALGGSVGTFISSPFYMVKTQLQARSAKAIAVGYQHKHASMFEAFRNIYKADGFFGYWRGALSSVNRVFVSSSVQIATFPKAKSLLLDNGWVTHPVMLSFCAGLIAGTLLTLTYAPLDLMTTRMYNQPVDEQGRGLMYKNNLDAFAKIVRTEGWRGLYKGFWPIYFRSAPHCTLMFVFFEKLIHLRDKYVYKLDIS
ncbi:hypothetical protein KR018_002950 [Drosophila ironensis]|nr:hypothetical protein KR018_002950 [Drosophila ironensis]